MNFCVADVNLNLTLHLSDGEILRTDNTRNIEGYLDNQFWKTTKYSVENTINVYPMIQLPAVGGEIIWETDICTVKMSGEVEIRIYHDGIIKRPYAIYSDSKENGIKVWCEINWLKRYYHTNYLFNICAIEKLLIRNKKIVLHSCYVKTGQGALLFSGNSGIGKSTQGALWEKYMQASVINGDRAVLGKRNGKWYAYGFPFSGTSGICYNVTCPLIGIVFLKQEKENKICRISPLEAVKLLWTQFTVNQWDADFVEVALGLINQIATDVPIYELCCTPDERAVTCTRKMLGL